jgi:purine-binding chemotaxis protein CheW
MNLADIRKKAQKEKGTRNSVSVPMRILAEETSPEDIPAREEQAAKEEAVPAERLDVVPYVGQDVQQRVFDPLAVLLAGRLAAGSIEGASSIIDAEVSSGGQAPCKYLCFRVAAEEYAISLMDIKEIVKPRVVTEVPHAPDFIKGIISLRGMVIPIFDLRLRLGFSESPATGRERFIIVKKGEGFCGLLVDEVYQVISLDRNPIEKPPAVLEGIDREFVAGIGRHEEHVFILMDMEKVLDISLI